MNLLRISIAWLLLCVFITFSSCSNHQVDFTGDVSINCGSTGASAARNGRQWLGDVRPKLSPLLQLRGFSAASTAVPKLTSADPVPHKTARISRSHFSYTFQLNPGQKLIRLHFNPSPYRGFKGFSDFFTVEAGPFILLGNFSASLTADALGVNTFVEEFCLNIEENQRLTVTFSPESSQLIDTYAFINGIEIVSVPATLSFFDGGEIGLRVVGQNSLVFVDDSTALEIVHRLNIKQDPIPAKEDFDGVFPKWATQRADKAKNNTWRMPVEVGFRYLIRLHFSEVGLKLAGADGSMFKILINEMIAHTSSEIVNGRDQDNIVWYRDYMVVMRGRKQNNRRDILIDELADGHGVLAGFEIVKLSNPDDSLASPNPLPPPQDSQFQTFQYLLSFLNHPNASGTVAITVMSLLCIIVHKLREVWEGSSTEEEQKLSANSERHCRRFPLAEIQLATKNFNEGLVIGRGGFGKVYKGLIDNGQKTVAIKRLRSNSTQGAREFLTEIETLSELRHMNLVSLIGYCRERREMILVYEYMSCGTLADHLYKLGSDSCFPLNWKQRLNICIGAARGLDYLHTGHGIIHRDVKASNILLDESFMAKVSDFGLARTEDRSKLQSHVITLIKGTRGYLDSYYIKTGKLTRKSDIFAFGVVLLEVLCGRPALDLGVLEEERLLSCWALEKINKGEVDQIVASTLREEISPNRLKSFVEVAKRCLHDEPKYRPTMSQIVLQLESALELQESDQNFVLSETVSIFDDISPTPCDGVVQSGTSQQKMVTTDVLNIGLTSNQQMHNNVVCADLTSGEIHRRKAIRNKQWKFWPWDTLWNQVKPSNVAVAVAANQSSDLCRCFSLREIKKATGGFKDCFLIGRGGLGSMYKGLIDDGATVVGIKRVNLVSDHVPSEFCTENQFLSELRHRHLVSLIGYCNEKGEKILVYDYMAHGTLRDHLHELGNSPLTWKQRLEICLGAAKGLDYLHTGAEHVIVHRNIKSNNILLDDNWLAKIGDLNLSKVMDSDWSHASTLVVGTFGYVDPEYLQTSHLTVKSDVYSFGVVLFEVLCARRAYIIDQETEKNDLATWGISCFNEGKIDEIIDSNLKGQIAPKCLKVFAETAVACLSFFGNMRPSMRDVIRSLESAMQLQEAAGIAIDDVNQEEISPNRLKSFVEVAKRCLHDEPKYRPTMSQIVLQLESALELQESNQNFVLSETVSISDDISPTPCDGVVQSGTSQQKMVTTDVLNIGLTSNQQMHNNVVYADLTYEKKHRRKPMRNKQWKLWPWDTLWNQFIPSKVAVAANQSSDLCRCFKLREIKKATGGFKHSFLISSGAYDNMYKGLIDDGATTVAIRRVKHVPDYVPSEFCTENQFLFKLRHRHLVSLIGYCIEKGEMILVYDYMAHGTLHYHLHELGNSPLTWKQRLELCLGAAKGLDYLHTGAEHVIIHGDVKSTNILLDENWVAKMGNLNISKVMNSNWSHVSTSVQGTFGYLDPEYFQTWRLTVKSDVYSFGVVLFEVLCAKKAIISSPTEHMSLATWGISCFNEGKLDEIIDSNLKGQIALRSLKEIAETAVACLSSTGNKRPTMRDVIRSLESAIMQLQEAAGIDEAPPLDDKNRATSI